ncbi:L-rhamnose/proton symporter RhaT [Terriglobus albidus]|nr:L-rhamnose/proton symporter RhaT [Terriglobus albidus]
MENEFAGLVLLVGAGAMNACFALPMKRMGRWAWENTWLVWSGFALVLLPLLSALCFIPSLKEALLAGGVSLLFLVGVCGFAWGIAQVLFGLAIDMIGVTLSFSIVLGLSAAVGSIVPFVRLAVRRGFVFTDLLFVGALALVLSGVFFCAWAGSVRDRSQPGTESVNPRSSFHRGLICAVCSGLGAAAMNIGISLGAPIDLQALAHGAQPALSHTAVWFPLLEAGAIPNLAYCALLLRRNSSYGRFSAERTGRYWLGGLIMAVFWFTSSILYSIGAAKMGQFGLAIGWPAFMAAIVVTAGIVGVVTGEWTGAPRRAFSLQATGMLLLLISILLLAKSSGKM